MHGCSSSLDLARTIAPHRERVAAGGIEMPMYVVLYRFTALGRRDIRGTVERAAEVRKRNEARGLTVHGLYWTQGQYDIVALVEAPNEQEMMGSLVHVAEAGNVSSETMRAFTEQEMATILGQVEDAELPIYDPTIHT
jgi:uncharacterized protein with GYD domain